MLSFKLISFFFNRLFCKFLFAFDRGQFHYSYVQNLHLNRNLAPSNLVYYLEQLYLLTLAIRMVLPFASRRFTIYDPSIYYVFSNKSGYDSTFVIAMTMFALDCFYLRHCFCAVPRGPRS